MATFHTYQRIEKWIVTSYFAVTTQAESVAAINIRPLTGAIEVQQRTPSQVCDTR